MSADPVPAHEVLLKNLAERNPEALLLEPRDKLDAAVVGIVLSENAPDHWTREPGHWIAMYDSEKVIEVFASQSGGDYDAALEWFGFNTAGAWVGEGTWTFKAEDEVAGGSEEQG